MLLDQSILFMDLAERRPAVVCALWVVLLRRRRRLVRKVHLELCRPRHFLA